MRTGAAAQADSLGTDAAVRDLPQPTTPMQFAEGASPGKARPTDFLSCDHLLQGLRERDPAAEEEFVNVFGPRCAALARKSRVPHADSEDIAQETMMAVILQLRAGLFREETLLRVWLFGILRRKIIDFWRKQGRTVSLESILASSDAEDWLPRVSAAPTETSVLVQQAVEHVRMRCREILVLSGLGGYTINEITQIVGGSPSRVGTLLAEAKHTVREALETVCEMNHAPTKQFKRHDGKTLDVIRSWYFLCPVESTGEERVSPDLIASNHSAITRTRVLPKRSMRITVVSPAKNATPSATECFGFLN
jgi:RNA polymerase sigma factor (sigma-70 family)